MKLFLVSFLLAASVTAPLFAEGSREINRGDGFRIITNVDEFSRGNRDRHAVYVFAKKGELINIGSSAHDSIDGADITVVDPKRNEKGFDVLPSGRGFIDTVKKERTGPFPDKGGYDPVKYPVQYTGVHRIQFNLNAGSASMTKKIKSASGIQTGVLASDKTVMGLSAWDVTVTSGGKARPGRVFLIVFSANGGFEEVSFSAYILTRRGFLYSIELPSMIPLGFSLYSVNKGAVDPDGKILHHSTDSRGDVTKKAKIRRQLPALKDSAGNETYKIFLNKPGVEISSLIPFYPNGMGPAPRLSFSSGSGNNTLSGKGGEFFFNAPFDTEYGISLVKTDNSGSGEKRELLIEGSCVKGLNRVIWDGRNSEGKDIPPFEKGSKYRAELLFRDFETHIILEDVENLKKGIRVRLLNPCYEPAGWNPWTVHYDNERYEIGKTVIPLDGRIIDLNNEGKTKYIARFPDPMNASAGVDSSNGACAYGGYFGDMKSLDFWMYAPIEPSSVTIEPAFNGNTGRDVKSPAKQEKSRVAFSVIVPFFPGSRSIDPSSAEILNTVAVILRSGEKMSAGIRITSSTEALAAAIAKERAGKISDYLRGKGIPPVRIRIVKDSDPENCPKDSVLVRVEGEE
jgi:hypothetical protein